MSYSRFMDRSLDDIPSHHMRRSRSGEGRDRGNKDRGERDHGDRDRGDRDHGERDHGDRDHGDADDRTLFVANLNYDTSWQELRDHLKRAGSIDKCDIFKDSHGYSKGFGLIVFGDAESAERALREYNDSVLNNRNMKLRKARPPGDREEKQQEYSDASNRRGRPHRDPGCTVFVHNLDYSVTWQKLKDIFKVVGRVVDVEVLDGRKGAAVVQYSTSDDAIKAIALFHGQMLMDRPMQLRMDSKSPYQPDPLKLKLASISDTLESSRSSDHRGHSRHHHSRHHEGHSRHEHVGGRSKHHEGHSRREPRPRSHSPFEPPTRHYSYSPPPHSPPPRHSKGYGRREEGYYSPPEREEPYYGRSERRPSSSYPERHRGYEKSRYEARSRSRSRERRRSFSPPEVRGQRDYSPPEDKGRRGYSPPEDKGRRGYSPPEDKGRRGYSPPEDKGRRDYSPGLKEEQLMTITSVFVKNLPFGTTWQTVKDEFRKAGLVKRAEIKMNKDGRPSGLALVWYNTHTEAVDAVSMFDDTNFDGRQINVQLNKMQPRQQERY